MIIMQRCVEPEGLDWRLYLFQLFDQKKETATTFQQLSPGLDYHSCLYLYVNTANLPS